MEVAASTALLRLQLLRGTAYSTSSFFSGEDSGGAWHYRSLGGASRPHRESTERLINRGVTRLLSGNTRGISHA